MAKKIIATSCKEGSCCPIVEHDDASKIVKIYDPKDPSRGSFVLTLEEWNRIIATSKCTL